MCLGSRPLGMSPLGVRAEEHSFRRKQMKNHRQWSFPLTHQLIEMSVLETSLCQCREVMTP